MLRRVCFFSVLAACSGSNNPSNANKPSCEKLASTCGAFSIESETQGHACFVASKNGSEAECAAKLDGCNSLCALDDGKAVVENYAALVFANYEETVSTAAALQSAVASFVAAPSATGLAAARNAWIAARVPYSVSEAFRFYDGPIDNASTGPEARVNAWPLDENYIDYVVEPNVAPPATGPVTDGGIINGSEPLTRDTLISANGKLKEEDVSTGYHAIEFLLWGQDRSATGPGDRPFQDYVDTLNGGFHNHQDRRRTYLSLVTQLLVDDLSSVRDAWQPGDASNYRGQMVAAANVRQSLAKIVAGIVSLAKGEVANERLNVAYETNEAEQEQSCFSDNTLADLRGNLVGIQSVYLGRYGSVNGQGISALVAARDTALDTKTKADLVGALARVDAIPAPFDQAIAPGSAALPTVKAAIDSVRVLADDLEQVRLALGLNVLVIAD